MELVCVNGVSEVRERVDNGWIVFQISPQCISDSFEENRLRHTKRFTIPLIQPKCVDLEPESVRAHNMMNTTSVSTAQHAVYLKWAQSERVRILVGPDEVPFLLPISILTQRSSFFHTTFQNACSKDDTKTIRLPETTPYTFEHIAIWALSTEPKLDSSLTATTLVDIAIFATKYLVPAILHHALDLLRAQIQSDGRVFTPQLAKQIYNRVHADSLLHHLAQASLPCLNHGWSNGTISDQGIEDWMRVIRECPDLASDYFYVTAKKWNPADLAEGGPCRFHQHAARQDRPVIGTNTGYCSRMAEECFEEVEQNPIDEQTTLNQNRFGNDQILGGKRRRSQITKPVPKRRRRILDLD